jgi:membrane-bound lytic murein transglycosylase D
MVMAAGIAAFCGIARTAPAQGMEVDWEAVSRIGTAVANQVQKVPIAEQLSALAASTEVDWEVLRQLVERVLGDTSWEDAAALRPYAEAALARMATVKGGADTAAWLRQRLDYLAVAEQYVREEKIPPPKPAPPPPPPGKPVPPVRPLPPAPKPVTPPSPVRHTVKLDRDTETWIRRLPADPPPLAQQLAPSLRRIFEQEGIPPALIWLAEVESAFNPAARSPVGAAGLYQFMPATASRFGLTTTPPDQRLDPERSARAAARYMRVLYKRFSDWPLVIAAYNAGEGRVGRTLSQNRAKGFEEIAGSLPLETRMYVPRVAAVIRHREGADLRRLPAPLLPGRPGTNATL